MKKFINIETKSSTIINFYRERGYDLSQDQSLYSTNTLMNLSQRVDELKLIIISTRAAVVEIVTHNGAAVPDDCTESTEEVIASSPEKAILSKVATNLMRGGIQNDNLLADLLVNSEDEIESEINIENIIIMEKKIEPLHDDNKGRSS